MSQKTYVPFLWLAIAVIAISFSAIFIRLTHTPSLIIAFYRQAFSAVLILPFVRREEEIPLSRKEIFLLILSGFFLAVHFAAWITGLFYTTVARATLFVDLQPIWGALLGALLLRESLKTIEIIGVLLVTVGAAVTVGPHWTGAGSTATGDLLALVGGVAGACYLLIGRKVRAQLSWIRYMYSVYYLSAIWLFLFCLLWHRSFPLPNESDILWLVLMALIPSLIGHGLFNLALRHFKAYVVNAAFLGEPIVATLLAVLFFREMPDVYFYAGGSVVIVGLFTILIQQR